MNMGCNLDDEEVYEVRYSILGYFYKMGKIGDSVSLMHCRMFVHHFARTGASSRDVGGWWGFLRDSANQIDRSTCLVRDDDEKQ